MTKRHCLTLDLQDDPELIAEYRRYHEDVWPKIIESIRVSGVESMEIYLRGTRMFMIMDTTDDFSFESKAQADAENPVVQK
jgi:L-rhamnose mutarotase